MPNKPSIKLLPPVDFLRTCLDYTPETGELRWKQRPREHFANTQMWKRWNIHRAGTLAGTQTTKYRRINFYSGYRFLCFAHRVIWKWMTGEDPPSDIDHKDRNPLNNRWENLRLATRVQAVWNRELPRKINPHRGVFPMKEGKWRVRIRINGIQHNLGSFSSVEEAAAAYEAAAREIHGDFYLM
jgi:hypothetical protein